MTQPDQTDVVFSVDRSMVEALVRNDLVDLVDSCRIPAVASSALCTELQVVIAESNVLAGNEEKFEFFVGS